MTHDQVDRFVTTLVVSFAAAAIGFAWWTSLPSEHAASNAAGQVLAEPAPSPPVPSAGADAALFDARCGPCHAVEDMVGYLRATNDVENRGRELAELLAGHGSATAEENARLVAHLVAAARR